MIQGILDVKLAFINVVKNMKNSAESGPQKMSYKQEVYEDELAKLITKDNITGDELFCAYELAMGFKPGETELTGVPREEVLQLATRLGEMMQQGFTTTRIVEMRDRLASYEEAPEAFSGFVDRLSMSEEAKRLLVSIVENNRKGTVRVHNAISNIPLFEIEIQDNPSNNRLVTQNAIAHALMKRLSECDTLSLEVEWSDAV